MKVADVMTSHVISVMPETPFKTILERFFTYDVRAMPVVDHEGCLVGMVSEADLIGRAAFPGPRRALQLLADALRGDLGWMRRSAGLTAAELMTTRPVTALPDEDLAAVAGRMLDKGLKRLPVVRGLHLVGIVSRRDVLRVLEQHGDLPRVSIGLDGARQAPAGQTVAASVREGVVTLRGSVRSDSDREQLESLVRGVPGVVDVVNQVTVREASPSVV